MKTFTSILFLIICVNTCLAQDITISGSVTSKLNNEKLQVVAITLFDASTNKLLNYTYSDDNGNYTIIYKSEEFYIKADLIGYKSFKSKVIKTLNDAYELNFYMEEDISELDEVIILQKKRLITMTGDKMIIEIDKSGLGDGNNGLETLSKLPGMHLDKDENLIFRGGGNLQILIDGKPSLLSGDALKQYLKTISGNNIKAVEIIANPSAKYDASGTGGILNIKLKKAVVTGLTGNIYTYLGYAEFIKNSSGLNLYNNTKKWNINAGLYYSYNESVNHRKVIHTIEESNNNQTILEQFNDWFPVSNSFTTKFGVAYNISPNASLGTAWNYNIYKSDEETIGRTNEYYNSIYERFALLNTNQNSNEKTLTGNIYYSYASDSINAKWDVQFNYARYDNTEDKLTSNQFFETDTNLPYKEDETVRNINPTLFNIFSVKVDFEKQLNKTIKLESGVKHSYVDNDYKISIENKNSDGEFVLNTNRSNQLLYKESISSFYGIANYSTEKWNFQVGLRSEYINYKATSSTNNQTNKDDYLSLFPSFSINLNTEKNQYKLSYSRRIRRPRYLYLNPFFEYVDTYNIKVGNPDLAPQFTDAFELTWVNKHKTALSLYAKFTTDKMDEVIEYDETTQITTLYQANIASSENLGISFSTTLEPKKWWEIQLYSDFSFNHIKSDIPNFSYDRNGSSWYSYVNQSFKFKNDCNITWNSFYSSGGTYGNSFSKPSYDMSFGLRKHFYDKKLRLQLKADNVFKTSRWRSITKQDNVTTNWTNRWETRKFTMSLTYNFGNGKKKRVKSTDLREEQNRL